MVGCELEEVRQEVMKSWRSGFMRWRRREEPWGSHHVDARALKWEISVGLTEELVAAEEDRDRRITKGEGLRKIIRVLRRVR